MSLTLPSALQLFDTSGSALGALTAWSRQLRGDKRALALELRDNLRYLDLVADGEVTLEDVVDRLSTSEFERLAKSGFSFNALKRRRIRDYPSLKGTDLAAWPGKTTEELVESIYDKLRDLAQRYPLVSQSDHYRWGVRVNNIRKRIWLLLRHVK